MKSLTLIVFTFLIFFSGSAQDTIQDTSTTHPFNKAILCSAVLPGAGQVYNSILKKQGFRHAIWKVPLIYGGLGATIYMLVQNQNTQKTKYKTI